VKPLAARARNRSIFRERHAILPVIHVEDRAQTLRNVAIARSAQTDGVFLINHGIPADDLLAIHAAVLAEHPDWWIGVNCLDRSPAEVFARVGPCVAGVWTDDASIRDDSAEQPEADAIDAVRRAVPHRPLYFGGFAFKHQRPVSDLRRGAYAASRYLDVITTSGPGTGQPADPEKIRTIRDAASAPVAIASGITPENVGDYLDHADAFLVATGISRSFTELDPARVGALVDRVRDYPTPQPWLPADDQLPADWAQRTQGGPLITHTLGELTARISNLHTERALVLRHEARADRLLDLLPDLLRIGGIHADLRYQSARLSSPQPIDDGFLTCLHLRASATGDTAIELAGAFVTQEEQRWRHTSIEQHLRRLYGDRADVDHGAPGFRYLDYPAFDSGHVDVDFGVLVFDGIWIWTRVVHHHK
jgi:uncharacterized protein